MEFNFENGLEKKEDKKIKTWVVEDREDMREVVSDSVNYEEICSHIDLKLFASSKDAFEEMEGGDFPDVLLIDRNLDLDEGDFSKGEKVIKKIRESFPDNDFLIYAFTNQKEKISEMLESGADGFVLKNSLELEKFLCDRKSLEKKIKNI